MLAPGSARATTPAPACVPGTLNTSARLDGLVTVSPLPGSRDATPQTQISFLGVPADELMGVTVSGSRTGRHRGRMVAYSQGDGASFLPAHPFAAGETVTMHAQLRANGGAQQLTDQFAIAYQDPLSTTPETIQPGAANEVQSFRSRPDLRPPRLRVTTSSPAVAPGEMFAAPYDGPGQSGPMILDSRGGLVWFKALPRGISATNFQVQRYAGRPVLTWWQGDISMHGFGLGEDTIVDGAYDAIGHVRAGNGLHADLHDFQLTPQGAALITAYDPIYCDLSSVGGAAHGAVTDGLLQEIDVRTGLVMFQWSSLDHVALGESYELAGDSHTDWPFDFFHINSIGLAHDGRLLISARNTWTVYDIDGMATGQIQWQLGGKHPTFTMGPGTNTAWQHDPRELPDGTFSVFDNGAAPRVHSQSRGIVLSVNPQLKTVTLVAQVTRSPSLLAYSQGNMQALAGGDWFMGWGQVPDFSELSPTGRLLFDAHFPAGDQSYRDFRFAWTGVPARPPTFAVARGPRGASATVYASWNGATEVASWRVLAGAATRRMRTVARCPRTGFETAISVPADTAGPYVTVQALDASGHVLGVAPATASLG